MKNVLYIHHTAYLCGASVALLKIIDNLDKSKYSPSVILLANGELSEIIRKRGIQVYIYPNITTYSNAEGAYYSFRSFRPWYPISKIFSIIPSTLKMYMILSKMNIDFVHITSINQIPSLLAAHFARIKSVFHVQEVLRKGKFGFRRKIVQLLIDKYADKIICIARHNANQIIKSSKVSIIYNSIDFNVFNTMVSDELIRRKYRIDINTRLVGILGGIVHHKGLHVLISAASIIRRKYPDVNFLVAGISPRTETPKTFRRRVKHIIEEYFKIPNPNRDILALLDKNNLKDLFIFTGLILDVSQLISGLDVLVFPITESHFGVPILEAGAMKTPVVASDFPSTREIITENHTGLLVEPNNPQSLAEKIMILLNDNELAKTLAENAYKKVRENFDLNNNNKKIYDIYDELFY